MKKLLNRFAMWLEKKTAAYYAPAYDVVQRVLSARINALDDRLSKIEKKASPLALPSLTGGER